MTERIAEVLIDPKWTAGKMLIDGSQHIYLCIEHPRHGLIYSLLPLESATKLTELLRQQVG